MVRRSGLKFIWAYLTLSRLQFFRCSQDPRESDEEICSICKRHRNQRELEDQILSQKRSWPNHMPPKPLSDLMIVIVEDHDDTRKSIGSYLDGLGANVIEARNAFEGLEVIKNNRPDLVLCDIQMPGGDGFELVRGIRLLESDSGGSVPVIAMTAFLRPADRARIINAGFQACLSKPFTPNRLVETILTLLNH